MPIGATVTHTPLTQWWPATQSPSPVHGLAHALLWHTYGKQAAVMACLQTPCPSHACPVTSSPTHSVGPQLVPSGDIAHWAAVPAHAARVPHGFMESTAH